MSITPAITTAEQLRQAGDIGRCELVRGTLVMMSPAGAEHGAVANKVAFLITRAVEARRLGRVFAAETGFLIGRDPDTVRAPDVAFVSAARLGGTPVSGYWNGAPDLAVEVLSPGDAPRDVRDKVRDWLDAGTLEVWVVRPAQRTIMVHREGGSGVLLAEGDMLTAERLVPGLRVPVHDVFA